MRYRNVTISLPDCVMREAQSLAMDSEMMLPRYLASLIEQQVEDARRYHAAGARLIQILETGIALGTAGRITWKREDLHER